MKLNAKQLRQLDENVSMQTENRFPVHLILDNIYDTYNIGGLFRLADALAIERIYLCGDSETPPNHRIKKASIGTYKVVPWEYFDTAEIAINHIRKQISDVKVVSIEQHDKAVSYTKYLYPSPIAFIVGNETDGVSKKALTMSDAILSIPMWGINMSLNVIVSAGVVLYHGYAVAGIGDVKRHLQ
jgi:tRNA G18 (ribose-2'-O)-methylase SpoU